MANWNQPPFPGRPPPKNTNTTVIVLLALVGVGVLLVVGFVVASVVKQDTADERFRKNNEDMEKTLAEVDADIQATKALIKQIQDDRSAQQTRLNKATFTTTRLAVFDGDCVGAGLPKLGYKVEGSTFADNALAADAYDCKKRYPQLDESDLFCCPSPLKSTFRVNATTDPAKP